MRHLCFCGRFLLPMLLICLQIPIQIDLVDSGRDRIAKQVLFIGLSFAYSLPCRCYAKGRAKHIFELVAKIVIGSLKRIAVLLYAKHHPKPIKRNDRLDHGNKEKARKVLGGVQLFLRCGDQPLLDIIAYHRACQRRLPQYCQVGIDIAHHLSLIKADVRNLRIAGQTEFLNIHSCVLPFIFYGSIIYDFGQ